MPPNATIPLKPPPEGKTTTSATYSFYYTVTPGLESAGEPEFNEITDKIIGFILTIFFVFGTLGNIGSFVYFRSKKRYVSNTTYMLITVNDIIVSVTVLPVGISFLSAREPGLFFGNEISCTVWWYLWHNAVRMSIFLVICLCISRTLALMKPFYQQKIRFLILAVVTYFLLQIIEFIGFYLVVGVKVHQIIKNQENKRLEILFHPISARPQMFVPFSSSKTIIFRIFIFIRNTTFSAPAFVVAASCIISAVLLRESNKQVRQMEIRKSRKRATITILLFALVYGVCNVPMVVEYILQTYAASRQDGWEWFNDVFSFDTLWNYSNTTHIVLIAANSAANPVLYYWRMSPLRELISAEMKRFAWKWNKQPNNLRDSGVLLFQPHSLHRVIYRCQDSYKKLISIRRSAQVPIDTLETDVL